MPQIPNAQNVVATDVSDGGFEQPKPGRYVLRIQEVRTSWSERDFKTGLDKNCSTANDSAVLFVYDIADGEFAAEYSRDFFYQNGVLDPSKDFLHQYKLYWGDLADQKAAGEILGLLNKISASNPGFDAYAAFAADQWQLFKGKLFGVVMNGTVKTNDRGYDNWTLRPGRRIYTPAEIYAGQYTTDSGEVKPIPESNTTDKRTQGAGASTNSGGGQSEQVPVEAYNDVPF